VCDIVYHYTSPDGILGILKNKELRFTDCQYLNDKGEFIYIRKPLEKAYKEIIKNRNKTYEFFKDFINELFARPYDDFSSRNDFEENRSSYDFDTVFKFNHHYVLCASMNPDTANMWNYYVKNGVYQGYNLVRCNI